MDNPPSSIGAGRQLDICRYISIGVHRRVFTDRFPAWDEFNDMKNRRINIKIVLVILILGENKRHIFSSCCEKSITFEGETTSHIIFSWGLWKRVTRSTGGRGHNYACSHQGNPYYTWAT